MQVKDNFRAPGIASVMHGDNRYVVLFSDCAKRIHKIAWWSASLRAPPQVVGKSYIL